MGSQPSFVPVFRTILVAFEDSASQTLVQDFFTQLKFTEDPEEVLFISVFIC